MARGDIAVCKPHSPLMKQNCAYLWATLSVMLRVCLYAASRLSLLQMQLLQNFLSRALVGYSCGWNNTRWSCACPAWPQHDVSWRGASRGFSGVCRTVPKLCIHGIYLQSRRLLR